MQDKELQKKLMLLGNEHAPPDQRSKAWAACTFKDRGFMGFTKRTAWEYSKGDYFLYEDLVQEVFLAVREAAKDYRPKGSAHEWRKEITVHVIFDIYRKKKRRDGIVRTIRFTPGSGIEDVLGDDPHLPPD